LIVLSENKKPGINVSNTRLSQALPHPLHPPSTGGSQSAKSMAHKEISKKQRLLIEKDIIVSMLNNLHKQQEMMSTIF